RLLLRLMKKRSSVWWMPVVVVGDLLFTVIVFSGANAFMLQMGETVLEGVHATFGAIAVGVYNWLLLVAWLFGIWVGTILALVYPPLLRADLQLRVLHFLAPFLLASTWTSLWIWLYVSAAAVVKLARKLPLQTGLRLTNRFLDTENKPF